MRTVVWFSCGATSAVAAKLALAEADIADTPSPLRATTTTNGATQ